MSHAGKYEAVLRQTLLTSLVYGRDLVVRGTFTAVVLLVFAQLWTTTYEAVGGGLVDGFTLRDIVWYLVVTETITLSAPRVSLKIDQEVKSGDLAYVLTKPYNYVLYHLAGYWGEALVRLPLNFGIGGAVALLSVGPPALTAPGIVAAALTAALGLALNFAIEAAIGLAAFWFEDTQPFFWIYQKLSFTIGGLFIPLDLFPGLPGTVARWLPFAAVTYAPARLFVLFSPDAFVSLLALQLGWLLVLGALLAVTYSRAVGRVTIHGG